MTPASTACLRVGDQAHHIGLTARVSDTAPCASSRHVHRVVSGRAFLSCVVRLLEATVRAAALAEPCASLVACVFRPRLACSLHRAPAMRLVVQHPLCASSLRFFCWHCGCRQAGCGERCCGRGGCRTHAWCCARPSDNKQFAISSCRRFGCVVRYTDACLFPQAQKLCLFPQAQEHTHCWGGHVAQEWFACTLMSISVAVVGMYTYVRCRQGSWSGAAWTGCLFCVRPTLVHGSCSHAAHGTCCRGHLPSIGAGCGFCEAVHHVCCCFLALPVRA